MGRPRIHPRRLYQATVSGVYFDQETGDELTYIRGHVYPDIEIEKNYPFITMGRQDKMCKKLARVLDEPGDGVPARYIFEPVAGSDEIERVGGETTLSE